MLYVPSFNFNLVSVNKLSSTAHVKFIFFPTYCLLQDLRTDEVLIKGKNVGNLYVLDDLLPASNSTCFNSIVFDNKNCNRPNKLHDKTVECNNGIFDILNCNKTTDCNNSISNYLNCNGLQSKIVVCDSNGLSCNGLQNKIAGSGTLDVSNCKCTKTLYCPFHLWHKRLVHAPSYVLQHTNLSNFLSSYNDRGA